MASLILGLSSMVGWFCCALFGVPLGIAAVITGVIGLKMDPPPEGGPRTQAFVGIVLGGIGILVPIGFTITLGGLSMLP